MANTMVHGYEDRLVAYLDILGWQDASHRFPPEKLIEALDLIHAEPRTFNAAGRQRILELGNRPGVLINEDYLKTRAAAFSDNIALSHPKTFRTSIFSIRRVCLRLLQLGFLTRGGITLGQLYHEDNVIFGPALNRAHEIEAKEAVFPRIICDDPVIKLLQYEPEFEQETITDARDGRRIVNLYRPVFANVPAYSWRQFLDDFYHFPATMEVIAENMFLVANDARKLSKWIYMRDYVEMGKQRLLSFVGES